MEETLGKRLRITRKLQDMTQQDVAMRAGMSLQGVADLERGLRTDPHYSTLLKLSGALGVDPHWLYTGEEPERPPKAPAPASGQQQPEQERDPVDELVKLVRKGDEATVRQILLSGGAPEGWVDAIMLPALQHHVGEIERLLREPPASAEGDDPSFRITYTWEGLAGMLEHAERARQRGRSER